MKPTGIEVRADKRRGIAEASGSARVLTSLWVGMGWVSLHIADALDRGVWRSAILWWLIGVGLFVSALRDNAAGGTRGRDGPRAITDGCLPA
jgi:hypothetical protein